jgi:hypothetical protein
MTFPSDAQHFRLKSAAIVPHQQAKAILPIVQRNLNRTRVGVAKRIHDRFTPYAIDLILSQRVQRSNCPLRKNAEPDVARARKLLDDVRECLLQVG